ncbi:hypothetical protein ASD28_12595 [Massilia sp. Root133]|jgi:hypothetical protein|uniref:hypothetical protein n=1 Tax=Massilia sp. Root133 TaxID=1736455 RepID=UPI0006FA81E4|nr:hypothetical protein [Massilia sp. Root133]KQY00163.1 hypothetical protein ASD28_12595 [Massilia sp. Root133]
MIDNQAIETMSEMLSLIKKYAKTAYPDVETESSTESRRRAWVITTMLAKLAEHAAESDLQAVLADNVYRTYSEREGYAHASKCKDREFMLQLHEFKKRAEEYKNSPITGKQRTDGDVIRELENLYPQRDGFHELRAECTGRLQLNLPKKEEKRAMADLAVFQEKLDSIEEKLNATEALASSRGLAVSFNRYRTVIEKAKNRGGLSRRGKASDGRKMA